MQRGGTVRGTAHHLACLQMRNVSVAILLCVVCACDKLPTPGKRAAAAARDSLQRDSIARQAVVGAADSLKTRTATDEWHLPAELASVGGMTLTKDNRLLLADAESGNVFEVDYRTGNAVKSFKLGRQTVHDVFVGITTTENGDVFELSRGGVIYHFMEGADGNRVEFLKHDTKLGSRCSFGGVAFDMERNSLLLACQEMRGDSDSLTLFWWKLDKETDRVSEFSVANPQKVHPDEVTFDGGTRNYVLFSSDPNAIVSLTREGHTVFTVDGPRDLSNSRSAAITRGGLLLMGRPREGGSVLARYRWH